MFVARWLLAKGSPKTAAAVSACSSSSTSFCTSQSSWHEVLRSTYYVLRCLSYWLLFVVRTAEEQVVSPTTNHTHSRTCVGYDYYLLYYLYKELVVKVRFTVGFVLSCLLGIIIVVPFTRRHATRKEQIISATCCAYYTLLLLCIPAVLYSSLVWHILFIMWYMQIL